MINNPNLLDVLSYMFDYIFEEHQTENVDDSELKNHLREVGFDKDGIDKAFVWLDNIVSLQDKKTKSFHTSNVKSVRLYTEMESSRLDLKCRNFLYFLESTGQLTPIQREAIIEQIMLLESNDISLQDLKWVVMLILDNNVNEATNSHWLEAVILDDHHLTMQ